MVKAEHEIDWRTLTLFEGLNEAQLDLIEQEIHFRTFPSGTYVLTIDQMAEAVYVILQGTVKIHVEQPDGSDVILGVRGPGEIMGEMAALDNLGRSANALTLEECRLCWMDRAVFMSWLETMPRMGINLARLLSRRLRLVSLHVQTLSSLDVQGRLARQLLAFADEYGQTQADGSTSIGLYLTQNDLGQLVGASRVRVNQVLAAFRRRGYLSIDADCHITLLNPQALQQCAR